MTLAHTEILETLRMLQVENLDIRTTTLGVNLLDCAGGPVTEVAARIREKLIRCAGRLVETANEVSDEFGIPIVNKRIAVTPIALVAAACPETDYVPLAVAMNTVAGLALTREFDPSGRASKGNPWPYHRAALERMLDGG